MVPYYDYGVDYKWKWIYLQKWLYYGITIITGKIIILYNSQ